MSHVQQKKICIHKSISHFSESPEKIVDVLKNSIVKFVGYVSEGSEVESSDSESEEIEEVPEEMVESEEEVEPGVEEIVDELKSGKLKNIAERSGREQDKEDRGGLETLRRDGYM